MDMTQDASSVDSEKEEDQFEDAGDALLAEEQQQENGLRTFACTAASGPTMLRVMSIASVAAGAVVLLIMLDGTFFARPADPAPTELAAPRCSFADLYPKQLVAYKVLQFNQC